LAGTELGEAVLARAVPAYRAALGSRLIAGYTLGSLAHGGFSALVSDADLGLILRLAGRFQRWRTRLLAGG
jgi:hypothetical protein